MSTNGLLLLNNKQLLLINGLLLQKNNLQVLILGHLLLKNSLLKLTNGQLLLKNNLPNKMPGHSKHPLMLSLKLNKMVDGIIPKHKKLNKHLHQIHGPLNLKQHQPQVVGAQMMLLNKIHLMKLLLPHLEVGEILIHLHQHGVAPITIHQDSVVVVLVNLLINTLDPATLMILLLVEDEAEVVEEAVVEEKAVVDLEHALSVEKKGICRENALLLVEEAIDLEVASTVEKMDTCRESALMKENLEWVEGVVAEIEPALNAVKKDICLESAQLEGVEVEETEHALSVAKRVTCLENVLLEVVVKDLEAASIVAKKVICPESVHKKENLEWAEVVVEAIELASTVERKDICLENAQMKESQEWVEELEVADLEPASNVAKKVINLLSAQVAVVKIISKTITTIRTSKILAQDGVMQVLQMKVGVLLPLVMQMTGIIQPLSKVLLQMEVAGEVHQTKLLPQR